MLGLTGAHRTGKTTLAQEYAKIADIPFVRTSGSRVFADLGLDPKADYPLDQRIDIQQAILDAFDKQYRAAGSTIFVADRTPIDMMAYMLADCQRQNVDERLAGRIEKYLDDCVDVCNAHFSVLVIVQPGIELVEEAGKAPANLPYMEHINHLVMGITISEDIEAAHYYIPRGMTKMERRIECIRFAVRRTQEKFDAHKRELMLAGTPMIHH